MDNRLETIQYEIYQWSCRNFTSHVKIKYDISSLLGMVEEIGELCHAILKLSQGIRGTEEEHQAKIEDAIGDLGVYLLDFCARNNLNFDKILKKTWKEVKQRDWNKNKKTGEHTKDYAPLSCDCYPGCWADHSKDWLYIELTDFKFLTGRFLHETLKLAYGSYVFVDNSLRINSRSNLEIVKTCIKEKYFIPQKPSSHLQL